MLMLTWAFLINWVKVQTQRRLRWYFSTFLHSWPHLTKEVILPTLHRVEIIKFKKVQFLEISQISSKAEFNFGKKQLLIWVCRMPCRSGKFLFNFKKGCFSLTYPFVIIISTLLYRGAPIETKEQCSESMRLQGQEF